MLELFLLNYLTLLTWTLSIIVDNTLMLNCLVLSGLIVLVGLRKRFPECNNIFLQKFHFSSIAYSYLLVKFLSLFLFFFCVYLLTFTVNKDAYINLNDV